MTGVFLIRIFAYPGRTNHFPFRIIFCVTLPLAPCVIPHFAFNFFNRVGLGDVEFGDGRAAEGCQVGAAAEELAHFVSDGAHVGFGRDAGAEVGRDRSRLA